MKEGGVGKMLAESKTKNSFVEHYEGMKLVLTLCAVIVKASR